MSSTPAGDSPGQANTAPADTEPSTIDKQAIDASIGSLNRTGWKRFKFWGRPKTPPTQIGSLDEFDNLRWRWLDQRLTLRAEYSRWFKWLLTIQVALADVGFIWYAFAIHWQVPATAMSAWLGSVVAQVIAIVLTITRGIFPAAEIPDHRKPHPKPPAAQTALEDNLPDED